MKSWTASQFQENQRFIAISRSGAIAGGMFGRTWNSRIFIDTFPRAEFPGGAPAFPYRAILPIPGEESKGGEESSRPRQEKRPRGNSPGARDLLVELIGIEPTTS